MHIFKQNSEIYILPTFIIVQFFKLIYTNEKHRKMNFRIKENKIMNHIISNLIFNIFLNRKFVIKNNKNILPLLIIYHI